MLKNLFSNKPDIEFKIIEHLQFPSAIIDKKFNILYANNLWQSLFNEPSSNLRDLIKENHFQKLESFIKNSIFKKDTLVDDKAIIKNSLSNKIYYSLFIHYYPISNNEYFIISLKSDSSHSEYVNKEQFVGVNIIENEDDIDKFISFDLIEIFQTVSDLLPLSLVNKNKIKILLDEREEIIWFKDNNENILLTNQKYFDLTGSENKESTNNPEEHLFFSYQKDLLKNLTEYSKVIRKPIVVNGIKYSFPDIKGYSLIVYPIFDKYGRNYSFFNVVSKPISQRYKYSDELNIFDKLNLSFIRVNSFGNILLANKRFLNNISRDFVSGQKINSIFKQDLIEYLEDFISSDIRDKSIYIDKNLSITNIENCEYILKLTKTKSGEVDFLFYPFSEFQEIKFIFSQRGKMLDYYIKNSPEPIFVFDKKSLKFLEINQPALELYGYQRNEMLKLDLTDLYSPEDFQSLMQTLKDTNNQKVTPIFKQKTKDGRDIYVQLTYNDFKYNDLDTYFVIIKDLTKILQLEKENQIYEKILENSSDIILECDTFGFIKSFNNSAVKLLGYKSSDLIDTSFSSLVRDEDRALISTRLFNKESTKNNVLSLPIKKSDGNFIETTIISIPIQNLNEEINSFRLIITSNELIIKPVPEIKEVVKEVYIEKQAEVFASTNQNYINTDFLSNVFHDILTPLNVIFGFSQEIIEGLENPTQEQKEAADIISQNRIKLLDTMNSVIEYSELISNKIKPNIQEFYLVDIIEKVEKSAKDIANTFGIQFNIGKISSSLRITSDADKLERVIVGLIKIVCRLTQERKVYLSAFPLDQNVFIISVTDKYNTSTDYLVNSLNKIFNLQVEPKDVGAPRLTVNLVRFFMAELKMKFVDKIKINDKEEAGFLIPMKLTLKEEIETPLINEEIKEKQFFISETLEQQTEEEPKYKSDENTLTKIEKELPEKPKINLSNMSCLYIEDQVDSQVLFKLQLKELKEIVFAPSFEEALPHLESRKFDFIVIDINIEGEYNGLDALKMIRKIPGYEIIPVFASTAYILPGNKERFIVAGFNDFIDKPILKERIVESLSKFYIN